MSLHQLVILPIQPLKKAGIFRTPIMPGFRYPELAQQDFRMALPGAVLIARPNRGHTEIYLTVEMPDQKFETSVSVATSNLAYGPRWFFSCPCCGERRMFLIVDQGRLVCEAVYLNRPSSVNKARRRLSIAVAREALADAKPKVTRGQTRSPAVIKPAAAQCVPIPRVRRPANPNLIVSQTTEFAINNGRGAAQYEIYFEYCERPASYWRSLELDDFYDAPAEVDIIERHPALDIRVLTDRLMSSREGVTAIKLCWNFRPGPHCEVLFFFDWRDGDLLIMACFNHFQPERRWQRLKLFQQENGRFRFVCPVYDGNRDLLYLRGGTFASREAQRLVNSGQRAAGRRNAARASERLRNPV